MDYHFSKDPQIVKTIYQVRKMKIIIFVGIFAVLVQHISCLPQGLQCSRGELILSHSQPYLNQRGADSSPKYLNGKTRSSNMYTHAIL